MIYNWTEYDRIVVFKEASTQESVLQRGISSETFEWNFLNYNVMTVKTMLILKAITLAKHTSLDV